MTQLAARSTPIPLAPSGCAKELRFRIEGWAAFGPGLGRTADRPGAAQNVPCGDGADLPPERAVPALLRRRVTPIGQLALRAAYGLGDTTVRFVFCSRHGEFQRTLNLLKFIVAREPASPADFSLSVHNALAGLLSIALKNTAGHTAIAAGADTFGFGLVEASACIADQPGNRVLLVYFDEALPNPYSELHGPADLGIAVALLVAAGRRRGDDLILSFEPQRGSDTPPSAHVAAFLGFLVSDRGELVAQGSRMLWRWRRAG